MEVLDIQYVAGSAHPQQRLDVFLPAAGAGLGGAAAPPLVVVIRGGAWVDRDKALLHGVGRSLAGAGLAAAVINYRLSSAGADPPVRHPDHTADCAAAIAWLRRNAAAHGFSADALFVLGHSAGAHMAGLMVLDDSYLRAVGEAPSAIRGVVGLNGIYDLPALLAEYPDYASFLVPAFGEDRAAWALASPQLLPARAGGCPCPWLVLQSPGDELLSLAQSTAFAARLRDMGATVALDTATCTGLHWADLVVPGEAGGSTAGGALAPLLLEAVRAFVAAQLP